MAAHRYWRAVTLEAYGRVGLELTEFQLFSGATRVDAGATLTSNVAPSSGSLADLKDNSTATGAGWPAGAVAALVLSWDFGGSPQDVTDVVFASASDPAKFLIYAKIQYSDDAATWSDLASITGIAWPGPRSKTTNDGVTLDVQFEFIGRSASVLLSNNDLTATSTFQAFARGRFPASTAKVQAEFTIGAFGGTQQLMVGACTVAGNVNVFPGGDANSWGYYAPSGTKWTANASSAYGAAWTTGDVIGIVYDPPAGTITFYKNGVSQGVAFTVAANTPLYFVFGTGQISASIGVATSNVTRVYPVSGAASWGGVKLTPLVNRVRGRVAPGILLRASSSLAVTPLGKVVRLQKLIRGRTDYVSGVLGQGIGRVKGTTKDKGSPNVPVSERVRLYREQDGLLVRETWSQAGTGAYSFDYVDELQAYTVISYDHDKTFRAVVADNLTLAGGGVELIA